MSYVVIGKLENPDRIICEPSGWGYMKSLQDVIDQTDIGGWEMYVLESENNFNNDFQKVLESARKRIDDGTASCGIKIVLKDIVRYGGKGYDNKDRFHTHYVSRAGTEWEKEHEIWAPKTGWYMPNDDCEQINGIVIPFIPGTLIPFETTLNEREAIERFEKYGLNPKYVSMFRQYNTYHDDEVHVAREFDTPSPSESWSFSDGRFSVIFGWISNVYDYVVSLPTFRNISDLEESEILGEIDYKRRPIPGAFPPEIDYRHHSPAYDR